VGGSPQSTGTRRLQRAGQQDEYEDERPAPPPPPPDKTPLYIGIGVGAVILVIVIAMMASGGEGGSGGASADRAISKAMDAASRAYMAGRYREALSALEPVMSYTNHRRSKEIQTLAGKCRENLDVDSTASRRTDEFKRKVDTAKADGTMMKKAAELKREVDDLVSLYRMTASGETLRGLRGDIERCLDTEKQGDWQRDFNPCRVRVETKFLSVGRYSDAVKEWRQFGEAFSAPELKSKIDQQVREIDRVAVEAAQKLVAEAGTGADARAKLDEAMPNYTGTEGQDVIRKALRQLK
jgi:hypothetical protein